MKSKQKLIILLITLTVVSLACGLLDIDVEQTGQNLPETTNPDNGTPNLPQEGGEGSNVEPTAHPNTAYWKYVQDNRYGVRFAVPCFWSANYLTPEEDPSGLGSFPVQNFDQAYIARLGAKSGDAVWQYGGMKLDIGYLKPSNWNLSVTSSLEDLAQAMYDNGAPNPETYLDQLEQVSYNGQQGLKVKTQSTVWGEGTLYMFSLMPDLVLTIGPGPNSAGHPDIEAILSSLALSPEVEVQLPISRPADPPVGMGASCLDIPESEIPPLQPATNTDNLEGTLDCSGITEDNALMWLACNIQDAIRSHNTQPLPGYMEDEFLVGFWQSEGITMNPFEALNFIEQQLPYDTSKITFTTDEALYPPLFGMKPEQIMNPQANIVEVIYSEGWGSDGQGAALLYLAQNESGQYYFYAMLIAQSHFDK